MLVFLGLDFQDVPVDVRERFHLDGDAVRDAYRRLAADAPGEQGPGRLEEALLVATCNRVEVYGWWSGAPGEAPFRSLAGLWPSDRADEILRLAYRQEGLEVVEHILRVTAGLESQVLGDIHIKGQVRRAFRVAREAGTMGPYLQRLVEAGFRSAKQVKSDTRLSTGHTSVGGAAVEQARSRLGGLAGSRCAILGCGKVGSHAARVLRKRGAGEIVLLNRTPSRARSLGREIDAAWRPWSERNEVLATCDVAIVATGAPEPVLLAGPLGSALEASGGGPLLVLDISMPRNVDPEVGRLSGVSLLDLDRLDPELAEAATVRREAVPIAEAILAEHGREYRDWLRMAEARAALVPLRESLAEIASREVGHLVGSEDDVSRTAERIVAKLLARPMIALRRRSERGDDTGELVDAIGVLFGAPPRGDDTPTKREER